MYLLLKEADIVFLKNAHDSDYAFCCDNDDLAQQKYILQFLNEQRMNTYGTLGLTLVPKIFRLPFLLNIDVFS